MSQLAIITLLSVFVVGNLILGMAVIHANPRGRLNRSFSLFLLAVLSWLMTNALADNATIPAATLYWTKLTMASAAAIPLGLLYIAQSFTRQFKQQPLSHTLALSLPFVGVVLVSVLTSWLIRDAVSVDGVTQVTFGSFASIYSTYFGAYFLLAFYTLYKNFRSAKGTTRAQLEYFLLGLTLSIITGSITNLILPVAFNIFSLTPLGPLSTAFLLASSAYSIIAHQLFDIRVIIRRTLVYSILLACIFATYSSVVVLAGSIAGGLPALDSRIFFTYFAAAIIIGMGFDPLRRWLQNKTDQFLFKKEYEEQTVLKELSEKLNNVVGLDEALEIVMQSIVKVLHLHHAATFVFQQGEGGNAAIKRIKQIGYSSSAHLFMEAGDPTIVYFSHNPGILIVDKLEHEFERKEAETRRRKNSPADLELVRQLASYREVLKKLHALNVAVAVPLLINHQPIGLILLSDKKSQETFSPEDLALIDLIGAQAISSIQKAKLYEGDQMKSEFVSIASHELLTPISAIEGYLSMILDENIGHVDPKTRDYLNKVYASAKRLSLLIKDLLSVSRIEAGRMKIEAQSLDIDKMINDTIDQLKFVAQEKNISLVYAKGKKALPPVWADPDRTMQILINLASNAIKYTKEGTVTLSADLAAHGEQIEVEVKDTGIGMTKEQQAHLFEKFYRVDSPETTGIIGTGLGLYITRSLLERMGGSISVKSTPGSGTSFRFTLPIFKVELSKI